MASMSIRCGVNHSRIPHRPSFFGGGDRTDSIPNPKPNQIAPFHRSSSSRGARMSAFVPEAADSSVSARCFLNSGPENKGSLFSENLDDWVRDSAVEIVKNLRKAPLLVQVFANTNGEVASLKTEKAIAEEWPVVTRRWKEGEVAPPDGVILVEELGGQEDSEGEDGTTAWGIVIQGKGVECGPECYLMKTSRVGSDSGLCSTHFCLTKVQGFRESALSQLTNCWLLK